MSFIEHSPPGTWRRSPFVRGTRYRVLCRASSYQGELAVGEILEYFGAYYGYYFGQSVFAFLNSRGEERTWVLYDDEPLESWSRFFAEVGETA